MKRGKEVKGLFDIILIHEIQYGKTEDLLEHWKYITPNKSNSTPNRRRKSSSVILWDAHTEWDN